LVTTFKKILENNNKAHKTNLNFASIDENRPPINAIVHNQTVYNRNMPHRDPHLVSGRQWILPLFGIQLRSPVGMQLFAFFCGGVETFSKFPSSAYLTLGAGATTTKEEVGRPRHGEGWW